MATGSSALRSAERGTHALIPQLIKGKYSNEKLGKLLEQWREQGVGVAEEHPNALAERLVTQLQGRGVRSATLGRILRQLPSLTHLHLQGKNLLGSFAQSINHTALQVLTLDRCNLNQDFFLHLPPSLRKLSCHHVLVHVKEPADGQRLEGRGGIRGRRLNDEDATQIARLKGLEHLVIKETLFRGDGLAALASLPDLRRLTLAQPFGEEVGPDGFSRFVASMNPGLESLSIEHTLRPGYIRHQHPYRFIAHVLIRNLGTALLPRLHSLELQGFDYLADQQLSLFLKKTPALTSLKLGPSMLFSGAALAEHEAITAQLQCLEVAHPSGEIASIGTRTEPFNRALAKLSNVRVLNLQLGSMHDEEPLELKPTLMKQILSLNLGWRISASAMRSLLFCSSALPELSLRNSLSKSEWEAVFADTMPEHLNGVHTLQLTACEGFPSSTLLRLLATNGNLNKLSIAGCTGIEALDSTPAVSRVPSLQALASRQLTDGLAIPDFYPKMLLGDPWELSLRSLAVNDRWVTRVLEQSPGLSSLSIDNCSVLRGHSWSALTTVFGRLKKLHWGRNDGHLLDTDPEAVGTLLSAAPDLEQLSLRGCRRLNDPYSAHLSPEALAKLKFLELDHCNISASTFDAILERVAKTVETLRLRECQDHRDQALSIGKRHQRWPQLKQVSIYACPRMSGRSIRRLVRGAPLLQQLRVYRVPISHHDQRQIEALCQSRGVGLVLTRCSREARVDTIVRD